MKTNLLSFKLSFFILLFSVLVYGQNIHFNVMPSSHYFDPYSVTVSRGGSTLYYTTDGTQPTLSSNSAINSFPVYVDHNLTINVFSVDDLGNTSPVVTARYFTGDIPEAKFFFKPPTSWSIPYATVDMIYPSSINGFVIDYNVSMFNTNCEGWFKPNMGFTYYDANIMFVRDPLIPISPTTPWIPAGSLLLYDYSEGVITNPPSCLNLGTSETRNMVTVKIYPNPAESVVNINSELPFSVYEIYAQDGRKISQGKITGKSVNISHLTAGAYFMKISSENNDNAVIQFIKK